MSEASVKELFLHGIWQKIEIGNTCVKCGLLAAYDAGAKASQERVAARKQIAVRDWADASVEHLEIDANLDCDALRAEYRKWYTTTYKVVDEYLSFYEWLRLNYGATDSSVETWSDD